MSDTVYRIMDMLLKFGLGLLVISVAIKLDRIISLLERMQWLQINLLK